MKITLKDGVVKEFDNAVSVLEIAKSISEGLARNACAGIVDGEVKDLRFVVDKDAEVSICTFEDEAGKMAFRHTASHTSAIMSSFHLFYQFCIYIFQCKIYTLIYKFISAYINFHSPIVNFL